MNTSSPTLPRVILKPRRAEPFFGRHPWVFSGAIARVEGQPGAGDEVLLVTDEVRQAVVNGSTIADVRKLAIAQGLRSLRQEAMRLVADDLTTIDEVIRNVYVAEANL